MDNKKLASAFSKKIFKCHLIMLLVSAIFTFFFGGFLHIEKPINGYIFSGFVVVGYIFLLYSECLIEARKNFYNVNGDRAKIDYWLGVKSGLRAHTISLIYLVALMAFYYAYKWFMVSIWLDNVSIYVYMNVIFRFFFLPFLSFFPNSDNIYLWFYLLLCIFPSIVCGISYVLGLRECKSVNDINE